MTLPPVQQKDIVCPKTDICKNPIYTLKRYLFWRNQFQAIQIGGLAAVGSIPLRLSQKACFHQIIQAALDSAPREASLLTNRRNCRETSHLSIHMLI